METFKSQIHLLKSCVLISILLLANSNALANEALLKYAQQPLVVTKIGKNTYKSFAVADRVRLSKEIANKYELEKALLDWSDLYAIVTAETDWTIRDGMGKNGRASRGLAQLEDSTAKTLGLDAGDPLQSLEAAAIILKEAAGWSRARKHSLKSGSLSVYYNLSTAARNRWDGQIDSLPVETRQHISNFFAAKRDALYIEKKRIAEKKIMFRRM